MIRSLEIPLACPPAKSSCAGPFEKCFNKHSSNLAALQPNRRVRARRLKRGGPANTLAEIGSNLYDELFPEAFKTRYRSLREKYLDKGLLIVSAEAAIPWEIVKPGEEDPTNGTMIYDDAHLCERFHLTRWVAEEPLPSDLILKEVVVVNPSSKLLAAHSESDFLFALHTGKARVWGGSIARYRRGRTGEFQHWFRQPVSLCLPRQLRSYRSEGVKTKVG